MEINVTGILDSICEGGQASESQGERGMRKGREEGTMLLDLGGSGGRVNAHSVTKKMNKYGSNRMRSKEDEGREATPEQEDIQPCPDGEDNEMDDIAHVLKLTAVQETKLREEGVGGDKDFCSGERSSSDDEKVDPEHDPDGLDDVVNFGASGGFSAHSRKEAKKARRPNFERTPDAVVRPGSLTRAGMSNRSEAAGTDEALCTMHGFAALGISSLLCNHLEKHGFLHPTDIQKRSIPVVLVRGDVLVILATGIRPFVWYKHVTSHFTVWMMQSGRDVMIESATGSGKTLCYLLPILQKLADRQKKVHRGQGTLALILCPTRELCLQVLDTATVIARRFGWIVPGSIHGGENRAKEKARLRKGLNVLIATPGRLLDHLTNTASFRISDLEFLVLDEADRLLDLGFKKQISSIVDIVKERSSGVARCQHLLLSATLEGEVLDLLCMQMKNPEIIKTYLDKINNLQGDSLERKASFIDIPKQLMQNYLVVPCKLRLVTLFAVLQQHIQTHQLAKILVFLSNCDSVDFHRALLQEEWEQCTNSNIQKRGNDSNLVRSSTCPLILRMHGNMPQIDRTRALISFTKASSGILFATDVASRGLDFPEISMIVQYDAPSSVEEYVHRVGRTARLGKQGQATLFIQPSECGFVNYLHTTCGLQSLEKRSTSSVLDTSFGKDPKAGQSLPLEFHRGANVASQNLKSSLQSNKEITILAENAFVSSVRAYATHSHQLKQFFSLKSLHLGHYANAFALKYVH